MAHRSHSKLKTEFENKSCVLMAQRFHSKLKTQFKIKSCVLMAHRFHSKLKIKMKIKRFDLISNVIFIISYYILLDFIFISCSVLLLVYFV